MGIDSRKFCCCLPVRLGVFVLSFFSFLGGGVLAGAIWYEFAKAGNTMPGVQKAAFIIAGVSWGILAIFSLCGLIGSIVRSHGLVKAYAVFMWFHFWLDLAASIFFLYTLFTVDYSEYVNECIVQSGNKLSQNDCVNILKTVRIVYTVVVICTALVQLYCSIIVSRYVAQLADEAAFKTVSHLSHTGFANVPPAGQASYYPHQPLAKSDPEEHHELLGHKGAYSDAPHQAYATPPPPGSYAYTDPHNAFGHSHV